jgi:pyridoxal phosphate enzyme (YggS family)
MTDISNNVKQVCEQIDRAAAASGRDPEEITLVAISKTFPVEAISEAADAGLRRFGENRVQEAEPKINSLVASRALEWHLVGHLQSNKAKRAAQLFEVIHSVDSIKLAEKLSQSCVELEKSVAVLIQVNLGLEQTKFGARSEQVEEIVDQVARLPGLRLDGFMTIPPLFENPEQSRPFFAQLRELRDRIESAHPGSLGRKHLSMGMSHDFRVAIEEGATIVRIGTAIFGNREDAKATPRIGGNLVENL